MESNKFALPIIAFPRLKLVIETYYLAGREKPDDYFGATELAFFSKQQSNSNNVSRNEISGCAFLLKQMGIIESRSRNRKYHLTELGKELGVEIKDDLPDQESLRLWSKAVQNCSFLLSLISYISQAGSIEQEELEKEIVYRSGGSAQTPSAHSGALTIINIFDKGGFIIKKDKDRSHKIILLNSKNTPPPYVSIEIISSLRTIKSKYDLSKLITLCEEINDCYNRNNYYAVGILNRTIIDYVPPIFGFKLFSEVANSYTGRGRSFRENMQILNVRIPVNSSTESGHAVQ